MSDRVYMTDVRKAAQAVCDARIAVSRAAVSPKGHGWDMEDVRDLAAGLVTNITLPIMQDPAKAEWQAWAQRMIDADSAATEAVEKFYEMRLAYLRQSFDDDALLFTSDWQEAPCLKK